MHDIDRRKYPELDLILWDRATQFVSPETAFRTYEQRWRYIDPGRLTEREQRLIKRLKMRFGDMLVA